MSANMDRGSSPARVSEAGMSLIEVMISMGILVVVMGGLMSSMSVTTAITENEGHLSARAAEYAQDKMEQLFALAYSDAASDTTQIPTAAGGGTGIAVGGSFDPTAPVALYVDYLDASGNALCPCVGTTAPAGWFYKRVWQISNPAGTISLKQITVTVTVARSVARAIVPKATMVALKTQVGDE
jgi:type II secretory pathway pseudopilin PulG